MKNLLKTTAAAIALTAVFAGPASAMVIQGDLKGNIRAVMGADSNITVQENNGVVTLTGYFSDVGDMNAAINAAKRTAGVDRVINLAFPNS